jgi:hypothetical protein
MVTLQIIVIKPLKSKYIRNPCKLKDIFAAVLL